MGATGPVVVIYVAGLDTTKAALVADGVEVVSTGEGVTRNRVVCIVSQQPLTVMAATARGFHGIIYDTPDNQRFSWHLRARGEADLLDGIRYRLKEWRHKHEPGAGNGN